MKNFFNRLLLLLFFVTFGCSVKNVPYYTPDNMEPFHISNIAQYIAPEIADVISEKQTIFKFKGNDIFLNALSMELQGLGYGTKFSNQDIETTSSEALNVTYTIDWIGADRFYTVVNLGEKNRITKLFCIDNGSVTPENQTILGGAK